jgi:hypothetical protein
MWESAQEACAPHYRQAALRNVYAQQESQKMPGMGLYGDSSMKLKHFVLGAGLVFALSVVGVAYAERYVVVNGQRLSQGEIMRLEQWHCGPIPNGHYWLNVYSGIWGYAGDPRPQGHIMDNCYRRERRPSLSERGMLFYPGELAK